MHQKKSLTFHVIAASDLQSGLKQKQYYILGNQAFIQKLS